MSTFFVHVETLATHQTYLGLRTIILILDYEEFVTSFLQVLSLYFSF